MVGVKGNNDDESSVVVNYMSEGEVYQCTSSVFRQFL